MDSAITLNGLKPSFTLTGIPGQSYNTVDQDSGIVYTVTTNNAAGYALTVTPEADALTPQAVGNTDSIPITDLSVSTQGGGYTPFVDHSTPITVYSQATESAEAGDGFASNLRVDITLVHNDTYTATLDYVATTL